LKVLQAVGAEQDDAETQYHQDGDTLKGGINGGVELGFKYTLLYYSSTIKTECHASMGKRKSRYTKEYLECTELRNTTIDMD